MLLERCSLLLFQLPPLFQASEDKTLLVGHVDGRLQVVLKMDQN